MWQYEFSIFAFTYTSKQVQLMWNSRLSRSSIDLPAQQPWRILLTAKDMAKTPHLTQVQTKQEKWYAYILGVHRQTNCSFDCINFDSDEKKWRPKFHFKASQPQLNALPHRPLLASRWQQFLQFCNIVLKSNTQAVPFGVQLKLLEKCASKVKQNLEFKPSWCVTSHKLSVNLMRSQLNEQTSVIPSVCGEAASAVVKAAPSLWMTASIYRPWPWCQHYTNTIKLDKSHISNNALFIAKLAEGLCDEATNCEKGVELEWSDQSWLMLLFSLLFLCLLIGARSKSHLSYPLISPPSMNEQHHRPLFTFAAKNLAIWNGKNVFQLPVLK